MSPRLRPCGTVAAYVRHRLNSETPCQACNDARLAYDQARRAEARGPRQLAPCGTYAANQRHLSNGETPCDACAAATRDYKAAYARRTRAAENERRQAFDQMLAEVLAEKSST